MENSKLFDLFKSLKRSELRRVRDFVQSPYFNKLEEVNLLCEEMISLHRRNWPSSASQPQQIFTRLFPTQAFSSKKWSYLSSDLSQLCERFMAYETLEQNNVDLPLRQMQACADRGLAKSFQRYERDTLKNLGALPELSIDLLKKRYTYSQLSADQLSFRDRRSKIVHLQPLMDELESFYLSRKFQIGCEMLSRQAVLNETYNMHWYQPNDLTKITTLPKGQLPHLFALAFELLGSENQAALLLSYTTSFRKVALQLSELHRAELYQHAINYCTRQIRIGHRDFIQRLLSLYQEGLEEGYMLEKGQLTPGNYKNIIRLGLGLKQFDWVETVVENYTDLLPAESRNDAYQYNLADISYYRQQYDRALNHLSSTEFTDVHYALGARTMLIKIYFERGETDPLQSLFSSFYIYLLRNKLVAKATKDAYFNFLRFTKQLYRAKSKETFEKIRQRIEKTQSVNDRTWLIQQLENGLK